MLPWYTIIWSDIEDMLMGWGGLKIYDTAKPLRLDSDHIRSSFVPSVGAVATLQHPQ